MHLAPLPPYPVPLCVIAWVLVAASTDLVARRIPNWLVGSGLVVSLAVQAWLHGAAAGGAAWLFGAAAGFGALFPFYLLRGMAAGDVKLMAMVGAWLGASAVCYIVLATFVLGGVGSLTLAATRGRLPRLLANVRAMAQTTFARTLLRGVPAQQVAALQTSAGSIPYGVAIAAGTLGVLYTMTH